MTKILMTLAVFLLFSVPTLGPAASFSGVWKVTGDIAGYPVDQLCTFAQDGKKLTGSCKSSNSDKPNDITGEIDDKQVMWTFKTDFNGQELTITFKGMLDDPSQFKGDIDVQPLGVAGTFSAKKEEAKTEETKKPQ